MNDLNNSLPTNRQENNIYYKDVINYLSKAQKDLKNSTINDDGIWNAAEQAILPSSTENVLDNKDIIEIAIPKLSHTDELNNENQKKTPWEDMRKVLSKSYGLREDGELNKKDLEKLLAFKIKEKKSQIINKYSYHCDLIKNVLKCYGVLEMNSPVSSQHSTVVSLPCHTTKTVRDLMYRFSNSFHDIDGIDFNHRYLHYVDSIRYSNDEIFKKNMYLTDTLLSLRALDDNDLERQDFNGMLEAECKNSVIPRFTNAYKTLTTPEKSEILYDTGGEINTKYNLRTMEFTTIMRQMIDFNGFNEYSMDMNFEKFIHCTDCVFRMDGLIHTHVNLVTDRKNHYEELFSSLEKANVSFNYICELDRYITKDLELILLRTISAVDHHRLLRNEYLVLACIFFKHWTSDEYLDKCSPDENNTILRELGTVKDLIKYIEDELPTSVMNR